MASLVKDLSDGVRLIQLMVRSRNSRMWHLGVNYSYSRKLWVATFHLAISQP